MRNPLLLGAAATVALLYVRSVDPNQPGHYPTCPFLMLTGWYCPGCGALRTLHALAHLDLQRALSLNVLVTVAAPLLVLWWVRWAYRGWAGVPRRWLAPAWTLWTLLAVVVAFGVLRNLPWFAVLAP
jgi:hypothetical protein